MNSNHNFDVNTKKRFNASLKKCIFSSLNAIFLLKMLLFLFFKQIYPFYFEN